jgi:hypothetical protein
MYRNLLALAAIFAMQTTALDAYAAGCTAGNPSAGLIEATPVGAFTNNGDGTVTHSLTGLTWKRCTQGLSGANCATGNVIAMTWRAALVSAVSDRTAGYADWRLPNKKELESIVESCGSSPAINQTMFPATPGSYFWTSTSYATDPTNAWYVNFNVGQSSDYFKSTTFTARLVRGGQSFTSYDAQPTKPAVIEYLDTADFPNSPGGHFFYSSDPAEQASVDAGAAGAFSRTGRQFLIGGSSPVCRFYGSLSPGPNSHFFSADTSECNALKSAQITPTPTTVQQWNFEGVGYLTTPVSVAANGVRTCPANTLPIYRAYNNAYPLSGPKNPWDSNHRFTSFQTDITDMVNRGWRDEGIVFCSAQ